MLGHYSTLSFIASDIRSRITGQKIVSLFTQESDQLVIMTENAAPLVVSCLPRLNALYLNPRFARARRNSVDLMRSAVGREITDVAMDPDDRIVRIILGDKRVESCFFGVKANVYLLDKDGTVLDSFKKSIAPSPSAQLRIDSRNAPAKPEEMFLLAAEPDESVSTFLRNVNPRLGTLLIAEALARASIPLTTLWNTLDQDRRRNLRSSLNDIRRELDSPQARIYGTQKGSRFFPERFSLVPLIQYSHLRERTFEDIHEAVRFFIAQTHAQKHINEKQDRLAGKIDALRRKMGRARDKIDKDLSLSQRAEEYEKNGRLLIANLHFLEKGAAFAEFSEGGVALRVPLERNLTPSANAQRYFEKARRARAARKQAEERLSQIDRKTGLLDKLSSELAEDSVMNHLDAFAKRNRLELESLGLSERQERISGLPFRVFHVDGGFEVWAGKNSRSNDELTMKHAKPNDLWFHARGAGGSHVLLKINSASGEPGKAAKHQAAAIAAFFSKMKNASSVPVAMTRKKYVRKPRGSPSGTVVIEKEETLFVKPGLPQDKQRTRT